MQPCRKNLNCLEVWPRASTPSSVGRAIPSPKLVVLLMARADPVQPIRDFRIGGGGHSARERAAGSEPCDLEKCLPRCTERSEATRSAIEYRGFSLLPNFTL